MTEEMKNYEETTEMKPVEDTNYTTEESSGCSTVVKVVIGLAATAVGTGLAFGYGKLKKHNRKKVQEQMEKEGYTIIPPEAEVVEAEVVSEEDVAEEETVDAK